MHANGLATNVLCMQLWPQVDLHNVLWEFKKTFLTKLKHLFTMQCCEFLTSSQHNTELIKSKGVQTKACISTTSNYVAKLESTENILAQPRSGRGYKNNLQIPAGNEHWIRAGPGIKTWPFNSSAKRIKLTHYLTIKFHYFKVFYSNDCFGIIDCFCMFCFIIIPFPLYLILPFSSWSTFYSFFVLFFCHFRLNFFYFFSWHPYEVGNCWIIFSLTSAHLICFFIMFFAVWTDTTQNRQNIEQTSSSWNTNFSFLNIIDIRIFYKHFKFIELININYKI